MELQHIAQQVGAHYVHNPKLEALFIGGSVSRGWQDRFSDIELFLLWNEPPTDEDRTAPIHLAGGTIIDFHPYEDNEWSETFLALNSKFEVSSFLKTTAETYIKDVHTGDTSLDKQCLLGAIADGIPLKGGEQFQQLKASLHPYPDRLKENMIVKHFELGGPWLNREALLFRDDRLMLYKTLTDVSMNLMAVLSALNGQYIHHPKFKWVERTSERFTIKPNNFSHRLLSIFGAVEPEKGVRELESLVNETIELVEQECPGIDIKTLRDHLLGVRPGAK